MIVVLYHTHTHMADQSAAAAPAATRMVVLTPGVRGKPGAVPVRVTRAQAEMSGLVKEMLRESDDDDEPDIPLPNISNDVLAQVVKFMAMQENDPIGEIEKPIKSTKMAEITLSWAAAFVDALSLVDELYPLILAANYLDFAALLDLCCAKLASKMKGKTPAQIRTEFNIENDFTPEEEEELRKEDQWVEVDA
jgi:S-phase kinase-associated protein 1